MHTCSVCSYSHTGSGPTFIISFLFVCFFKKLLKTRTWNSSMDFPLLDSSMKRNAPIPVLGLSASSLFPCEHRQALKVKSATVWAHIVNATYSYLPTDIWHIFVLSLGVSPMQCNFPSFNFEKHQLFVSIVYTFIIFTMCKKKKNNPCVWCQQLSKINLIHHVFGSAFKSTILLDWQSYKHKFEFSAVLFLNLH